MQILLIMALFGVVFSAMAALVNTSSQNAILQKQQEVNQVKQMFLDVEQAVNVQIIGNYGDFSCCRYLRGEGGASGYETALVETASGMDVGLLAELVPWTVEQLTTDPWRSPLVVISAVVDRSNPLEYIHKIDVGVEAPIRAFALVSPGPDRHYGVALANEIASMPTDGYSAYRAILSLKEVADSERSDDIVHTFSTRESMQSIWNDVKAEHAKMVAAARSYYQQSYQNFLPQIETYLGSQLDVGDFDKGGGQFLDTSAELTGAFNMWREDASMQSNPAYPRFPNETGIDLLRALGVDSEKTLTTTEAGLSLFGDALEVTRGDESTCGGNPTCVANARQVMMIEIKKTPISDDDWKFDYTENGLVDGRVIIE